MSALSGLPFPRGNGNARKNVGLLHKATRKFRDNAGYQIGNPAAYMVIASPVVAPVAAYEAWFAENTLRASRYNRVTGRYLHRAVLMIRSGHSVCAVERSFGFKIGPWLARLPPELAA